jgi:hypothetical protein
LTEGWFPEKNIEFTETNSDKSDYAFEFKDDGTIIYLGSLEGLPCPVGVFTMKNGNRKIQDNFLTLELRGLIISDYWYWRIVKYEATIEEDRMFLKVNKIIKNREISPIKT